MNCIALDLIDPVSLQSIRISSDHEYKTKSKHLKKICASMEEAVKFMKNKDSCRNTKKALTCIKNSLPVLEIFQNEAYLTDISDFVVLKSINFDLNDSDWAVARSIALNLMANNVEWVSAKFYSFVVEMVKSVLISDEAHQVDNEKCLALLCDVSILTEICCHGLSSRSKEVGGLKFPIFHFKFIKLSLFDEFVTMYAG